MFPYRIKYTESEPDIQNNNLLYKIQKNAKILSNFCNISKYFKFLFCYIYIVCINVFVKIVIWGFVYCCSSGNAMQEIFP